MASMNFWGVEVKGKEPNSVEVDEGQVIHVSQATLGEAKKDNEHVTIRVKVGDKKLVMGMLSQKNPQLSFDLVFDEDFEISHNWKNGSIHFLGYQTDMLDDATSTEKFSDSSDGDEDVPALVPIRENGKPATVAPAATKAAAMPNEDNKPKRELKVGEEDDESDDDEDGSDDESDDDEDDVDMLGGSDESDEEGSEDDDDEEETPKMVQVGKKRSKTDAKTPEPKKAKLATPQKTDSNKSYPPGADKSTPKSNGHVSGGSSKKTFNSGKAFGSHSKGKHGRK